MRLILEPLRLLAAIPNVKEHWCLPEMDLHDANVDEDCELLRSMIAGDEQGFMTLYQKYQGPVFRFALQICGIRHVAEEVTQDAFVSLIRAPHNYQSARGPLLLYMFGIARRLVWKNARRDRLYAVLDSDQDLPVAPPDFADDFARKDEAKRLRQAILSLPRKYREVIVLCSLQELSYEDAAVVVGRSIGTVRSRMHRAKHLLLRKLREGGSLRSSGATAKSDALFGCKRGWDYDL